MGNPRSAHVKARAVLKQLGYSNGEAHREYKDWHIEIKSGLASLSVWSSAGMVFLSLNAIPVFHRPGPWEQYLDYLFHRMANGRGVGPSESIYLPELALDPPDTSADN